jgi:hypothetical protein
MAVLVLGDWARQHAEGDFYRSLRERGFLQEINYEKKKGGCHLRGLGLGFLLEQKEGEVGDLGFVVWSEIFANWR